MTDYLREQEATGGEIQPKRRNLDIVAVKKLL